MRFVPMVTQKENNPRIFYVAMYFYPAWGVGTFRAVKFCKYLRRNGFRVTVFTSAISKQDNELSFQDDVAGIHIIRFGRGDRQKMRVRLQWVLMLPFQVIREAVKAKPKVIIYTGPPFTSFLLAPIIKLILGVEYILDFRDPWVVIRKSQGLVSKVGNRLRSGVEYWSIRGAAAVLFVTDHMRKMYENTYPRKWEKKWKTIENGFDPEDREKAKPFSDFSRENFNIVYTGKLFQIRNPEIFFRGLREVTHTDNERGAKIQFHHVGEYEEKVGMLVRELGLQEVVKFWGPQKYYQTLGIIAASDLCLIVGMGETWEPTTKIYDYLAFKKVIMALTAKGGYVEGLVRKFDAGVVAENDDFKTVERGLLTIMKGERKFYQREGNFRNYWRSEQASQLIEIIKSL